jgi:hypothetical protein
MAEQMAQKRTTEALVLGVLIAAGLAVLGHFIGQGIVDFRALDRSVAAKGLSEREVPADTAIWPIRLDLADNDLESLTTDLETKTTMITDFLRENGFTDTEITVGVPAIIDRRAQRYGGAQPNQLRFQAGRTVTVYSHDIEAVRTAMTNVLALGRQGVAVGGQDYDTRTQFMFTGLNDIKPGMIEEATRKAREVAQKFAQDSDSSLGKIKTARQGQFSITDRDSNTPHIKKVRVVATLEYYLND